MNYNEFFELLASDNSRNFKTHQLEVHINDNLLQRIIFMALDPFTNYYIRKIPKYESSAEELRSLEWALDTIDLLSSRKVTGHRAIDHLWYVLSSLTPDDAKVVERVIKKDLKCGVSEKTVNSVWPNLIPEYPCMLCEQWDEKYLKKVVYPAYVQKKEDGGRVNILVNTDKGTVEFRSRNGKLINLLGYYEKEFLMIADGRNVVFDGEILVDAPEEDGADRFTGNGLLTKAIRGTITPEEIEKFKFVLFDIIPYNSFLKGLCKIPYSERYDALIELPGLDEFKKCSIVETYIVNDYNSAIAIFNKYIAQGFEGIVLKKMDGIWENKRVKYNLKNKLINECELRVVGVKYGDDNKYEGYITSLVCESEDGILKVSVGSGMSKKFIMSLTEEYILDKIITSRYTTRLIDKRTGIPSLEFARFKCVREDKNVADFEKDIK